MAAQAQGREGPLVASSYRPLYRIQHVIYKIGDIKLPFPVGFDALALFFLYLAPLAVLARALPTAFSPFGLPPFVTVPVAAALLAHASARLEPAGKGILEYLGGLAAYAFRPRWWVRGAPAPHVPQAASGRRRKVALRRLAPRLHEGRAAAPREEGEKTPRPARGAGTPALWGRPAPAAAGAVPIQEPEPREPEAVPGAGRWEPSGEPEPAPALWAGAVRGGEAAPPAPRESESPPPGEPEAAEGGEPPALWGGSTEEPGAAAPPEAAPARPKRQGRGRPARRAPKRRR
jgi:hypothetical protein